MSYRCRLCDKVFSDIPADAVIVAGHGKEVQLVRMPNGELHDLKLIRQVTKRQHDNWHRKTKDLMCRWCYLEPKIVKQEHVTDDSNQTQEAQPESPTPPQEATIGSPGSRTSDNTERSEIPLDSLSEPEEDTPHGNQMRAAFAKLFKNLEEEEFESDSIIRF